MHDAIPVSEDRHTFALMLACMQVFWDLENCRLNPQGGGANALTPHMHYDLLIYVLATTCGVRMQDFHLHVGIAQDNLHRLPDNVAKGITARHSPWVSLVTPLGKTAQKGGDGRENKEDLPAWAGRAPD